MPRLEFERLLDCVDLLRAAAERLEARGQVRPQGGVLGIRAGRPRKQRLRLFWRAAAEHPHAEFVEYRGVVRRLLRDPREQLV